MRLTEIDDLYTSHEVASASAASTGSPFANQELLASLIMRDVHDIQSIVACPNSNGKARAESGAVQADEDGEEEMDQNVWIYELLRYAGVARSRCLRADRTYALLQETLSRPLVALDHISTESLYKADV